MKNEKNNEKEEQKNGGIVEADNDGSRAEKGTIE